ncbi:MFS transporter [Herbidospora galbida]|uniref:MFS transporter n=1 Tax=Herbidospora galbida TaxID=2575442 RepID=A0A4U3MFK6_9ACTN|nr:MFS transporter [Herbidospora galbida]
MTRPARVHRAWIVGGIALIAIIGAAGFRATPGVLITPLQDEFGWSRGTIGFAVSINLMFYGLTAPFAAALMDRFGMRRVVTYALALVALGSGVTVFMTASWQLVLCWGVLVGLGTGSMALVFAATLTQRWFVRSRGLVTGILTAGGATGQLIFLPVLALLVEGSGWRTAALVVAGSALAVVPLVFFLLRDHPADVGLLPYGATEPPPPPVPATVGPATRALSTLRRAARTRSFWYLAGGFAICGASTNGLVGTHFIPAAHDHGMAEPVAAGLLAVIGIFDIAGTILSGWLSDRIDARVLLGVYYALRGASLLILPQLFSDSAHPSMVVFIVFYGLDWVATVPPTVALCRKIYGDDGPIVFGWVFASHQIGAAFAATLAGVTRDHLGTYDLAWYVSGGLCALAAIMSIRIARGAGSIGR